MSTSKLMCIEYEPCIFTISSRIQLHYQLHNKTLREAVHIVPLHYELPGGVLI